MTSRPSDTASSRPALSDASRLNLGGMLAAVVGIVIQIATGVDYPTIPPGPIVLLVAVAIVALGRWRWSPIVGVIVPAFLLIGGTIAGFANDELWDPGEPGQFFGLLVQAAGVITGLIGGILALPRRGTP
jgi:hypothetical protein